ncbi:uncharacterized protein LOC122084646 [Macadamia integrifolia]|uniref:uncharacterized protein LOC122084646 n=1 Tax=Macadamia integrifolia TaxID=60698 RepID=UPI001C4FB74D|nr:uncharacterized protein LOC122084646 [Macadamia integrifolia]
MVSRPAYFLLFLSFQSLAIAIPIAPFNASEAPLSSSSQSDESSHETTSPSSHFLKDVLKSISLKQSWDLDEIRVSNLDVGKVRIGSAQRYEFRLRLGKSDLVFKFFDEVHSWRKIRKRGEFKSLVSKASSETVLKGFKLEGPFEIRVDGDDDLSLVLPMNTTHNGLKRVLVGEGITVGVEGAQEVSLFHTRPRLPLNGSSEMNQHRSQFWPLSHSLCMPLLPIHILGSASLVAYRTHNPSAYIEIAFPSQDMIELLPEKCYDKYYYKKRACPIDSMTPRLAVLESLMRTLLGDKIRSEASGFLKAKVIASTVVSFRLELERDVKDNDKVLGTLAEWRTKATVERAWFEVEARVGAVRLKPLVVKKVRPFIAADSAAWSNLMSNISFTKFPSLLVPPEALTLDVKW